MTRKIPAAVLAQRRGLAKLSPPAVDMLAPAGVGGSAPRRMRELRWQDRSGRRAREQQLTREPWCAMCAQAGQQVEATEVDHITPRHAGGSLTDASNLRSLCHDCHVDVTLADRAKRTGRPVKRRPKIRYDPETGFPLPGQNHPWSDPE